MKWLVISVLFFLFVGCQREFKGEGKNTRKKITVNGECRTYRLYLPETYDSSKNYPLLIAMHGRYGNSKNMAKSTLFSPLADEFGFIVVYPDGYEKSWNDGRGEGPAAEKGIDDVQFIETLIETIQNEHTINPKRIYATGMSNGGFMAMRLACELNDKIAAFSSVTGSLSDQLDCQPNRSVPVLLIAGTADDLVPYDGGEVANSGTLALGFDSLIGFWGANNECLDFEITALQSTKDDGTQVEKIEYSNCEKDKSCLLFKVINGGHTWPSGENFFGSKVVGLTSTEIIASREIVEFSLAHELTD